MTESTNEATTDDVTELVEADQSAREDASQRAQRCAEEVAAVLERHRCRIIPWIDRDGIEPVGMTGDRVIIRATYGIFPLAE